MYIKEGFTGGKVLNIKQQFTQLFGKMTYII